MPPRQTLWPWAVSATHHLYHHLTLSPAPAKPPYHTQDPLEEGSRPEAALEPSCVGSKPDYHLSPMCLGFYICKVGVFKVRHKHIKQVKGLRMEPGTQQSLKRYRLLLRPSCLLVVLLV